MELSHIPKIFWYSVSLAIFLITITFSWAALQSKGMTIEIANAKIAVTGQLTELEKVNENLKRQLSALNKTKSELEAKIKSLEAKNKSGATKNTAKIWRALEDYDRTIKINKLNEETFIKNTKELDNLRQSILQSK